MKNLTAKMMLVGSGTVITVVLGALILFTWIQLTRIDSRVDEAEQLTDAVLSMKDTRFHIVQIQQFLTDVGATADDGGYSEAKENLAAAVTRLGDLARMLPETAVQVADLKQQIHALHDTGVRMAEAYVQEGREAGNALMKAPEVGLDDVSSRLADELDNMAQDLESRESKALHDLEDAVSRAEFIVASLSLLVLGLVFGLMLLLYRKIIPPVQLAVRIADDIAEGDLSNEIKASSNDEVGQLLKNLNKMQANLRERLENETLGQEVAGIIDAAQEGDLTQRIDLAGKEGVFRQLGQGVNRLLDVISGAFEDIARVMGAMAQGDLTQKITKDYAGTFASVQGDVNATIDSLQEIVSQIRESTDVISTGSDEIVNGNNNLSERTEQQASSLEETASSMEELTSTVRNNADNSQQANQLSTDARALAEKGGSVVSEAVQAMEAINASSTKIAEIIGVIDEIAFQTNLLALNASVEAARAGEQGRGFAVVATEVRNLAQRSAMAAKEIKELIQDSVAKVQAGSGLVNESGSTLEEIVNSVKKVGDIIAEIAAASQEQSAGIDQVNQAVAHMDEMTQQNAALAEETSAASVSMREQAQEMTERMGFFRVSGSGPVTGKPTSPAPTQQQPAPAAKRRRGMPTAAQAVVQDEEWEEF
jgi:methyl-accepting chemotaxis protein